MSSRLEHANIVVRDIDAALRFLQTALPDLAVRHEGRGLKGRWLHVGTADSFVGRGGGRSVSEATAFMRHAIAEIDCVQSNWSQ